MGLTVITTYLRPPEKWSLFGRKRSHDIVLYRLIWAHLRPPKTDLSNLYIKGICRPQNSFNHFLTPSQNSNKKRDTPVGVSLYKVLGFN